MTGAQHYKDAERDIKAANEADVVDWAAFLVARAQVHATLALIAITAEAAIGEPDPEAWLPVLT